MNRTFIRKRVSFMSGKSRCIGYFYFPSDFTGKIPCVILGAGFGGTQDTPSILYNAERFAKAGFAAFTFDYRCLGESEGEPRQHVHIQWQIEDFHAAIAYVRSLKEIDSENIALWGSSLGGGHVITVAAEDPRIAAVVAQVPFNGFPKKVEGEGRKKQTFKLLWAMVNDKIRSRFGVRPYYIKQVGNPGDLAVMASMQAKAAIENMTTKYWRNEIAPRGIWAMMKYKPSDYAMKIKCPVMLTLAEHDAETTSDVTRELAEKIPNCTVKTYPINHFGVYDPKLREQISTDQIRFLKTLFIR